MPSTIVQHFIQNILDQSDISRAVLALAVASLGYLSFRWPQIKIVSVEDFPPWVSKTLTSWRTLLSLQTMDVAESVKLNWMTLQDQQIIQLKPLGRAADESNESPPAKRRRVDVPCPDTAVQGFVLRRAQCHKTLVGVLSAQIIPRWMRTPIN